MTSMLKISAVAGVAALLALTAPADDAHAIAYDISWTGASGYSLTGQFSFNDALIGTGVIDESDLDSLTLAGFQGATAVGTWDYLVDGLSGGAFLNFNFNTTTEMFSVGGSAASPTGQQWNVSVCGVTSFGFGFFSGTTQGLCLDGGNPVGLILASNSTLTATQVQEMPEAAALGLFGLGLAGLGVAGMGKASARRKAA
jgi:hypothetical protein